MLSKGKENNMEKIKESESQIFGSYSFEEKEIWVHKGEKKIYGRAFIPEADGPFPLVIYLHELLHNCSTGEYYAKVLASHGLAAYIFDFCGGGDDTKSDGKLTEMSVMTEADDIEVVYAEAKTWDFVIPDKIILLGSSQGGFAGIVAATRHPENYVGLIAMYPPLLIHDEVRELFNYDKSSVPETYSVRGWYTAGGIYATDMWDYDVYDEMKKYKRPVLLMHGSDDKTIDKQWSQLAQRSFPDAKLYIIEGGRHIFHGERRNEAMGHIMDYLRYIGILE